MKKRWAQFSRSSVLGLIGLGLISAIPANATLTFACNNNIDLGLAGTCASLNSTVSGFYDAAFTDVNAKVYILYGSTGLGGSDTALDGVTYANYRTALGLDAKDAADTAAFNSSVPLTNPFGSENLALTHAGSRALGLAVGTNGICVFGVHAGCSSGGGCTITGGNYGSTCFDSVITISDAQRAAGALWYRSLSGGAQAANQYDFFSVVFHESDEVLGTISLCCGEIAGFYSPSDLLRWSSNGSRSHAFGDNATCTASNANNACLSFDGGLTFVAQYNNFNNGQDTGDFASNCLYVQDAIGCLGENGQFHNPQSGVEFAILDVTGFDSAVPEPGTLALFAVGLAVVGLARRRRA